MAISLQLNSTEPGRQNPSEPFAHLGRFWDKDNEVHVVRLQPGDFYVTCVSEMITTVLGSCISACIYDRAHHVGGMNHFMLPQSNIHSTGSWDASDATVANRFGNFAMEHLVNEILKSGGKRENLEVKLFGGGRVLNLDLDVSDRNIAFADEYIRSEGLRLAGRDLGSNCPRKVNFFPVTGKAFVKRLSDRYVGKLETIEQDYSRQIEKQADTSGDLELF